jgi:hypothetical protein
MPDTLQRLSGLRLTLPGGLTMAPDAPAKRGRRPGIRTPGSR